MRHAIEFTDAVAVLRRVVPDHGPLGGPIPEGDPRRAPREARHAFARGRINGNPFLAEYRVAPDLGPPLFGVTGHLLTVNEERAIQRAIPGIDARIVDLRAQVGRQGRAERDLRAALQRDAYVFLDVPATDARARLRGLGAMWHGDERCWFALAGVDLAPFAALGATPRTRPEWRRIDGIARGDREARERAKALGARWFDPRWYVDVAVADTESIRELREGLGLRIMETQEDLWAWKDANGCNAEPAADAFPEWGGDAPAPAFR